MNFNEQDRSCHSERSEESLCPSRQILRFAQNDSKEPDHPYELIIVFSTV